MIKHNRLQVIFPNKIDELTESIFYQWLIKTQDDTTVYQNLQACKKMKGMEIKQCIRRLVIILLKTRNFTVKRARRLLN